MKKTLCIQVWIQLTSLELLLAIMKYYFDIDRPEILDLLAYYLSFVHDQSNVDSLTFVMCVYHVHFKRTWIERLWHVTITQIAQVWGMYLLILLCSVPCVLYQQEPEYPQSSLTADDAISHGKKWGLDCWSIWYFL